MTGMASAAVIDCDNCMDCSEKIQNASVGDVVRLTTDITNCSSVCIDFNGSDGITFDIGGHVIDGTGLWGRDGIYLGEDSNNNIVKNGTVREFYTGIEIYKSLNNTIIDVVSKNNMEGGIYLNRASSNTLTDVSASWNGITGNPYGIRLCHSNNNDLTNVSAVGNKGFYAFGGIWADYSNNNVFTNLTISDNDKHGIYIKWYSTHNKIRNATITTNEGQGGLYVYAFNGISAINDIDTSNTINGKPIQFFDGQYKTCPDNDILYYNDTYSLIHFYNGDNITLHATTLEDSVFLWSTHNSKIYNLTAHGYNGIIIWGSDSNVFMNITASNNSAYGFDVHNSNSNRFVDITSFYNACGFHINDAVHNVFTNTISNYNKDGMFIRCSGLNIFDNLTLSDNSDNGIEFVFGSYSNTINNSYIEHNTGAGICFSGDMPCNNVLYNNFFNNANNSDHDEIVPNVWNTTRTPGTNIVGGSEIGGNYWSDYDGTDADDDGFGDVSYDTGCGIDNLPLVYPAVMMCGDVDGNGFVSANDVVEAYGRAVDPSYPLPSEWAADVDGNGYISANDVVEIYRRAVDPNHLLNCVPLT
jgi:parallel beta-helix repeat protein